MDRGSRYTARLTVLRVTGQRTWELVTTPGAIFRLRFGYDFGGGVKITKPGGVYEVGRAPKGSRSTSIELDLADQWKRLEECRLRVPLVGKVGDSRVGLIRQVVSEAIPGVVFRVTANGGNVGAETTWDRDRTSVVNDLARDGEMDAYFDTDGVFVIEPDPTIAPHKVAATYADGPAATIVDLSLAQAYTKLYNGVIVEPMDDGDDPKPKPKKGKATQEFAPQQVWITDPNHPRHPSKIGFRPAFYSSPTIGSTDAAKARRAGEVVLKRFVNELERIEVDTWGQGDRVPGDTVATVQSPTYTDGPRSGVWLVEKVVFDAFSTATTITARSNADVPTEES